MEVKLHQRYNLNILRGLAILSLMILHAIALTKFNIENSIIQVLISRLHLGIPLFFLISGYLISLSWDRNLGKIKKYAFSRTFKILPLYIIFLHLNLITFFILSNYYPELELARNSPNDVNTNFTNYIVHLFFLQGFSPNNLHTLLDGSWSIINEVIFYVIFPLIVHKFKGLKSNYKLYCISLIICICFVIGMPNDYPSGYSYYIFPSHLPTFVLGIITYHLLKNNNLKKIIYKNKKYIFLISFIIMIGNVKGDNIPLGIHHLYSIAFFMILTTILTLKVKIGTFIGKFLSYLGKQTYSLYFTHLLMIKIWVFYFDNFTDYTYVINLISNLLICIPFSILFSHLFFNKIDLYFVRLGKKILNE